MQADNIIQSASPEELDIVQLELKALSKKFGFKNVTSLGFPISYWGHLSKHLTSEYPYALYRYWHALAMRDSLYRIETGLTITSDFRLHLSKTINPIDQLFKQRTVESKTAVRPRNSEMQWWWYRKPHEFLVGEDFQFYPEISLSLSSIERIRNQKRDSFSQLMFEELVSEWVEFAIGVKQGYKLSPDDYSLSLYRRENIYSLMSFLEEHEAKQISEMLTRPDEMFRSATTRIEDGSIWSFPENPSNWWWYRIPKIAIERFYQRLQLLIADENVILPKGI